MVAPGQRTPQAGGVIIHAAGHDVACRTAGSGPVGVILVHGIGVSGRYFTPLARVLARSARVWVLDLPGFGGSPRPAAPLSIREHADVVAGVIATAGLRRPVVVGHSMGAQVATELALVHPKRVGALVLIGPVVDPTARSGVRQAARLLRDVAHESPATTVMQVREWLRCGPRWYAATLPRMLEYPMEERAGGLRQPTALVRGDRDPVSPARYLTMLARRVPAGTVAVPRAGHVAMARRPEAVADVVLRLAG